MTPEELTQEFVTRLKERLPDAETATEQPLEVDVKLPDDMQIHCSLHNVWAKHEAGEDADDVLEAYLSAVADAIEAQTTPAGPDCIIPTVRSLEYLESIEATTGERPVAEPLAGNLWIVYAFDRPSFTQPVMPGDRERLEISDEEMRRVALENLPGHLDEPELHWFDAGGMITAGGDHEASLLLVDALWDAIAGEVPGDMIACAPARDTLLFTGTEIDRGVARMLDTALTVVATGDHVISDTLLKRAEGRWEVYPASEERASVEAIHEAIALLVEGEEGGAAKLKEASDHQLAAELVYDVADEAASDEDDPEMVRRLCDAALALEIENAELREALVALQSSDGAGE